LIVFCFPGVRFHCSREYVTTGGGLAGFSPGLGGIVQKAGPMSFSGAFSAGGVAVCQNVRRNPKSGGKGLLGGAAKPFFSLWVFAFPKELFGGGEGERGDRFRHLGGRGGGGRQNLWRRELGPGGFFCSVLDRRNQKKRIWGGRAANWQTAIWVRQVCRDLRHIELF